MVLTTPRTLGTPRRPGDRLVTVWLAATVLMTCAASADAQSSNSRVARLSQDLAQLLTESEVTALRGRLTALRAAGRMPVPHGSWPAIPWPAF